jgi:ATP-dependent RNA helicase DeaD
VVPEVHRRKPPAKELLQPRTVATTQPDVRFEDLGLEESLLAALRKLHFVTPSDIQRELIPHALKGHDCLGQAKTGTGKTAAFALPMLQRVTPGGGPQALVLVPTRELAVQVDEHVRALGSEHPVRTVLIYGGQKLNTQIDQLKKNPEIVVGTPGRVLDMMHRKHLHVAQMKLVILDEVDRMLDIGFREDIRKILKSVTSEHQTIFVSATIDDEIRKLARTYMRDPVEINVSRDHVTVDQINQGYVTVDRHDKFPTLVGLIRDENPTLAIVFTNTKHAARRVAERLKKAGVNCKEIHGDLDQRRRERVMKSFRNADIHVLVATDLASRGLDVMEVSHIINYDIPVDTAAYVHRIGRTARMGQSGHAITFVEPGEGKLLTDVEKLINKEVPQIQAAWVVARKPAAESAAPGATPVETAGATAPSAGEAGAPATPGASRLTEALRRDETLESLGIKPVQRTLGSRFRPARRR